MNNFDNVKSKTKDFLKTVTLGQRKVFTIQLTSFDYCQLELEYVYKKAGNVNNAIHSETLKLVYEKDNEYDPNAIAVYAFNVRIGYVPADQTDDVRSLKHKELIYIRLYYFNEAYRAELNINHRSK